MPAKPDPEKRVQTLDDVWVLVFGDRVWGKGPTLREALDKASKPTKYVVFLVHKDTYVDEMGSLQFPLPYAPREISRRGIPKETKTHESVDPEPVAAAGQPAAGRPHPRRVRGRRR